MSRIRHQIESMSLARATRRTLRAHLAAAMGLPVRPVKLRIGLTDRCNSRCKMCGAWQKADNDTSGAAEEISIAEIEAICGAGAGFLKKTRQISLTGGEPTLRSDLVEVVETLTRLLPRRAININTNGFLTERIERMVSEVLELRDNLSIYVSLDGVGPTHDEARGVPGAFDKTAATIEALTDLRELARQVGRRLALEVNFVMTEVNAGQLLPVFEYCEARGLPLNPILAITGELYSNCEADVALSPEARRAHEADAEAILRRRPSLHLWELRRRLRDQARDFDCWAGYVMLLIEDDTTVFPNGGCPSEFALGRLRDFDYSLPRLMASPRARGVLDRVRRCRLCTIACESNTTLRGPEALAGWSKSRRMRRELERSKT